MHSAAGGRTRMLKRYIPLLILSFLLSACPQKPPDPVGTRVVRVSLVAPSAKSVSIAGSFNKWNAIRDRLSGPDNIGVWTLVLPLPPGTYEFRFVIDGREWVLDPAAPKTDDGMGTENSLLFVP